MRKLISSVFIIIYVSCFSQEKVFETVFQNEILIKSDQLQNDPIFKKIQTFYQQEEWDALIENSSDELKKTNLNQNQTDYYLFFRGVGFWNKQDFETSSEEFQKISNSFLFKYHVDIYLGYISFETKKYKEALNYFKEIEKLTNNEIIGLLKSNLDFKIGLCYLELKDYKNSELYLLKATKSQEKINDNLSLVSSYLKIAILYYEQYKDEQAIPYFEKAYKLSKQIKEYKLKQFASLNMSLVEENRKNYSKALSYRKEFELWKDSVNIEDKRNLLAEFDKKLELNKIDKEALNQIENKTNIAARTINILLGFIVLLMVGMAFYFLRKKSKK